MRTRAAWKDPEMRGHGEAALVHNTSTLQDGSTESYCDGDLNHQTLILHQVFSSVVLAAFGRTLQYIEV